MSPSADSGTGGYTRVLIVWVLVLAALYAFQESFR